MVNLVPMSLCQIILVNVSLRRFAAYILVLYSIYRTNEKLFYVTLEKLVDYCFRIG